MVGIKPAEARRESSFLKKRSKRLYESGLSLAGKGAAKMDKSFLLLFLEKEDLPFSWL
jgi:hypothetical protein